MLKQAYGREADPLEQLTTEDLDRKLELCREVLKVLDIVTPGYTVTRGNQHCTPYNYRSK